MKLISNISKGKTTKSLTKSSSVLMLWESNSIVFYIRYFLFDLTVKLQTHLIKLSVIFARWLKLKIDSLFAYNTIYPCFIFF